MTFFNKRNLLLKTFFLIIIAIIPLHTINAQESASVYGTVFDDANGDGIQDEGEAGIPNVVIVAIEEDTGAPITATTDSNGDYTIEADEINHRIRVDESSLPFNGELTTSRLEYNLNVPPAFFAPNINFGYREVPPANVYGTVFNDANGNGQMDENETGLSGVTIIAIHDETGAITTLTTDANGEYNLTATPINHRLRVDILTLPFNGQLTTGREEYNLNVPPDYFTPNINFGYQEVEPANVYGTVFNDANGNGTQDEGEAGLSGVTIIATHDETGAITTLTTDANGEYNFTATPINHRLKVDILTLPFNGQLTTGREEYNLNVPPDYFTPNINFGYQEVEPANVYGTVFNDANGNGTQDESEAGLSGVTLIATHDETGDITLITTDANGEYNLTATPINHRLKVDILTLPFNGQLTTGREEYNLNIPPDYFSPNINFGYQEAVPSVVTGTVFEDLNDNGQQDDNEKGIPNVTLDIVERDGDLLNITTNSDGTYRVETMTQRFALSVDDETLPFATPILTTGRDSYSLNIPNGFLAPNVNFGYRAATSDDFPPLEIIGGGTTPTTPSNPVVEEPDDLPNPFDNPDPDLPLPDELPDDAGTYALPLEGTWTVYNGALNFNCGGMSFDQPPAPPESATITLADGGRTITGFDYEGNSNTLTASDTVRGLYTTTITVTAEGGTVTMDFFAQVVTQEYIVGYLTGTMSAQGMSCNAYRPFEMEYAG